MIPESEWVWCGYAGHFIAAQYCRLHLHTRVGDWRVSTVGDYHPPHRENEREMIGCDRYFETFVFPVSGHGEHGEGVVADWGERYSRGYDEAVEAEIGHMQICRLAADPEVDWETVE